jgi:putative sigma-54 modulation protein
MDASDAVQSYASEKLQNIVKKYVQGMDVDSQVVFSVERYQQIANFTINVNGLTVKSVEKSDNMYSSIDLALDKVDRQMKRFKAKIRSHRPDIRQRNFTMQVITSVEEAEAEAEAEAAADFDAAIAMSVPSDIQVNGAAAAAAPDESSAKPHGAAAITTVKREQYAAPYLSPDQAILQLELRHSEFFVFTNRETEHISIVYKRDDGNYGLIEPEKTHQH